MKDRRLSEARVLQAEREPPLQRSDPEVKYAWCFPQEGREGRGEGKEVTGQCAGSSAPQEDFWVYAE